MPEPVGCPVCRQAGPACGPCSVPIAAQPEPCIMPACGGATIVRSPCGAARHYHGTSNHLIAPGKRIEVAAPPGERIEIAAPGRRIEPEWKGQAAARRAAQRGKEQPILRAELLDAGLPGDRLGAAVAMWNELMRGIDYNGPHRTALGILNGTLKHKGIPDLPPVTAAELAPPGDGPVWSARSWLILDHPDGPPGAKARAELDQAAGSDLLSLDVNGMYLGAGAIDLGTGDPERIDWPDESVLRLTGWVRVSTLEGAPWSIGERWSEGMWMPIPIVAYLHDAGAEFLMVEAVVQRRARRWLDPHVDLMRAARTALMLDGSPEATAVLDIVKSVYTRMFGGLLASVKHNETDTLRPWWRSSIEATGQARMFRGLDKTRPAPGKAAPVHVIGVHVDAAWLVLPRQYEVPPGLVVSHHPGRPCADPKCHQLGKFKQAARTSWSVDLLAAYVQGEQRPIWRALHEAEVSA